MSNFEIKDLRGLHIFGEGVGRGCKFLQNAVRNTSAEYVPMQFKANLNHQEDAKLGSL